MNKKKLALAAAITVGILNLLFFLYEIYVLVFNVASLVSLTSKEYPNESIINSTITYIVIACIILLFNLICIICSAFLFKYIYKYDFSLSKEEKEEREKQKSEQRKQAKKEKLQAQLDELNKE